MVRANQSRQRGTGGLGECSCLGGENISGNSLPPPKLQPPFSPAAARAANRLRLQLLARRLHALGPKPLFHFLDEVERGADLRSHLERYAALPADFIRAYGGDRFAPFWLIDGGRQC
jgi:hypothetical protein